MQVSFAYVTDIHYGFDRANKKGSQAPRLIKRFIAVANRMSVDFAVNGGDRVIQTSHDSDLHYAQTLRQEFNALSMPMEQVNGNHDCQNLTNQENAALFGVPEGSYFRDMNGYRLIFWNPPLQIDQHRSLKIGAGDIVWLEDTLNDTQNPCILFSHIPLDNTVQDDIEATKRDKRPSISFYPTANDVRRLMEGSGKVILCIAGHRHRNRHSEINGIHYITHQSLVQIDNKTSQARGAFSIIKIQDKKIIFKGYGIDQPSYVLPRFKI